MEALIITSDASIQEQLEQGLRRRRYALTHCLHPEDAAPMYRPDRHALVIADVRSRAEGIESLRCLRKLVDAERSLLLAVVSPDGSEAYRTVFDAGADDALVLLDGETLDLRLALAEHHLQARQERRETGQRQAETLESITGEAREKWLGRILDDSKNEIYVFDAEDLRFIQVNRGARENLGFSMDALREMTPLDLKPEFDADTFEQLLTPLRTGEKDWVLFATVHRRKDGSLYPVEVSLQLSSYVAPPVFVAIILDATERVQAEQALRESEARAQAFLETTVDAIITIDEHGLIASFNKAAEKIFGYTAEEAAGQNVKILMSSPYRESHDQYIQRYLETGEKKIIGIGREVVARRKDGTLFPIDLAVSEVPLGGRRLFTGIIRDLSERKRLEREVLEVSAQEQQRIGQELHDGLGSHLTGVALLCRALARRLEKGKPLTKDDVEEVAQLVQEGAEQARLLARGLNPVRVSDQGLQTALEELAATMQALSGVPCRFQREGEIPPQDAETTLHLYRIAQEALNNALKHARAQHIWIRLAYKEHAIVLSVRDDGVGLPEKALALAGGIGHRVMQHRAHLIGATLSLRSAPGGGAMLSCRLPLDETNHPATVALRQPS